MAASKFGVVVSKKSAFVRRFIFPADISELDDPLHVGEGEVLIRVSNKVALGRKHRPRDQQVLTAIVGSPFFKEAVAKQIMAKLGRLPGNPRCAVIDDANTVVNVIMADAEIDKIEGMRLVQSSGVSVGDTYDPTTGQFSNANGAVG